MPKKIQVALQHKHEVADGVYEYVFVPKKAHCTTFVPGQYVWLVIPLTYPDPRGDRRAFSLTSSPDSGTYSILFRVSESGFKKSLRDMTIGQEAELFGPHGSLFDIPGDDPLIFIGAGVGIAPMLSYLRTKEFHRTLHIVAVHTGKMIGEKEVHTLCDTSQTHLHPVSHHALYPLIGTLSRTVPLGRWIIIGPQSFCDAVSHDLKSYHIPPSRQYYEEFYPYGSIPPHHAESEQETYKKAVISSGQHVIITDQEGRVIFANPAAERITGYTFEEMRGSTPRLWGGLMSPSFYKKLWHQIKIEKKAFVGEIRNRRKDGVIYDAIAHIAPILNEGRIDGFVGTEEDISKIKSIEQQLTLQTELLNKQNVRDEAILASIGDAVIVTDEHLHISHVNQSAERLLGYSEEELLGKLYFKAIHAFDSTGEQIKDAQRTIVKVFDSKTQVTEEAIYQRKDGTKLTVKLTSSPLVERNVIAGVVQVIRDVTREKEVDRMKTEFISLASHQLRTPLSAMRWYSEMLLAGDAGALTPPQQTFVQNISDSSDRMIALVNALLNISRIESGRIVIDAKEVDIIKLTTNIIGELQPRADIKKQQIILSAHTHLPLILLDPKLIHEVFVNLLTNAIKYTPEGGEIVVFISKKGTNILIQVSDTGYGIPASEKANVFRKFYRGSNITKIETDGTGLGLYLVKAIVESSGGEISFRSEAHKGTTFWFTLPIQGVSNTKATVAAENPIKPV